MIVCGSSRCYYLFFNCITEKTGLHHFYLKYIYFFCSKERLQKHIRVLNEIFNLIIPAVFLLEQCSIKTSNAIRASFQFKLGLKMCVKLKLDTQEVQEVSKNCFQLQLLQQFIITLCSIVDFVLKYTFKYQFISGFPQRAWSALNKLNTDV